MGWQLLKSDAFTDIVGPVVKLVTAAVVLISSTWPVAAQIDLSEVNQSIQPKIVKLYGAGGLRRLEAYQTGLLISDDGYILTAWSHLIDGDTVTAVLADGQRLQARFAGYDPLLEIAVLKVGISGLAFFDLSATRKSFPGERVLAFCNMYGIAAGREPVSLQLGVVSNVAPLNARRGSARVRFDDDVLWLDAITSNPGAAGGAVTDLDGNLLAMIGGEVRNQGTQCWLNFGLPISLLKDSIERIKSGKINLTASSDKSNTVEPWTLDIAGFSLVPSVVRRTPPYIESIVADSPAQTAGLQPDDLVVDVNSVLTPACQDVESVLATVDRVEPLSMTVRRGNELLPLTLRR